MKCGVLIIGSLYWDKQQNENTDLRINWRKNRLNMDENIHVFAPIRYGRLSGKKDETYYTMVLSKEIEEKNQHGTPYLIPFKNQIFCFRELFNQGIKQSK